MWLEQGAVLQTMKYMDWFNLILILINYKNNTSKLGCHTTRKTVFHVAVSTSVIKKPM